MKRLHWAGLGIGLAALDQISKYALQTYWPELVVKNFGSAFSAPVPIWVAVVLSFVCLGYIGVRKYKDDFKPDWILAVLAAGIIGNLIDRVRLGYVIDFINFKIWPIFNLADVFLTLPLIYLIYVSLLVPNTTKH